MSDKEIKAIQFLIDSSLDLVDEFISDKDKAELLFAVKTLCLQHKIERPNGWYRKRNRIDWIDDHGNFIFGFDLGGF